MTPDKKAALMTLSYMWAVNSNIKYAKQCALKALEYQMNLYNEMNELGLLKENSIGLELAQVKEEIEKIKEN
jgi:hypothetical protein